MQALLPLEIVEWFLRWQARVELCPSTAKSSGNRNSHLIVSSAHPLTDHVCRARIAQQDFLAGKTSGVSKKRRSGRYTVMSIRVTLHLFCFSILMLVLALYLLSLHAARHVGSCMCSDLEGATEISHYDYSASRLAKSRNYMYFLFFAHLSLHDIHDS